MTDIFPGNVPGLEQNLHVADFERGILERFVSDYYLCLM